MRPSFILFLAFVFDVKAIAQTKTCLAPFWGNLLTGYSDDFAVRKILGKGLERIDPSGKNLFYADSLGGRIVRLKLAGDGVVYEIELTKDIDPKWKLLLDPKRTTLPNVEYASNENHLAVMSGIKMGSDKSEVIKAMGDVVSQKSTGLFDEILVYESICSCELSSGITFRFKEGKLRSILYWSEPG